MLNKPATQTANADAVKNSESAATKTAGFVDEREALNRVPVSRKTWHNWRKNGLIPFVKFPGSRRVLYHWPSVESALLRLQSQSA